jgi:ribosomal protein S18 acetylase RimI-like enzyme
MTDTIALPGAPPIPGLVFRRFRGEADYPAIVAVRAGSRDWDQIDPLSTLEGVPTLDEVRRWFTHPVNFDPATDLLFVEIGGQVVGYSRVTWWTEQDGVWLYLSLGSLLPSWRGRGIGSAMLHWAEQRLRERAAGHPTTGHRLFGANASSTERDATALLVHAGYRICFRLVELGCAPLERLPAVPLPAGLVLRPAAPEQFRAIWEAIHDAYADSPQHALPTEEEYRAWLHHDGLDPTLWQVAWDGDQVVGQVLSAIARGRGEVTEVSVRHAWRRRGVARALLVRALETLRERGVTEVRLHTRADNPYHARELYERVGFRVVKEFGRYRKAMDEAGVPSGTP